MLEIFTAEALTSLLALTFLEIVLGIDNIVFLAVSVARLPADKQSRARQIGLWMAMVMRIVMLFGLALLTHMEASLFSAFGHDFTIESLVLIAGGLFLLAKGTMEVHHSVEGDHDQNTVVGKATAMGAVLAQIAVINVVFSLDSVITAVGMTDLVWVMITAVVLSTLVMLFAAKPVADFIDKAPTTKILALSFILLVGVALVADGFGFHIPRGYLYFAIAFSLGVELLNQAYHRNRAKKTAAH
ncbi:TerC family protein [Brevundimonas sp.]|uniref:TerC family protein n=1 Tax=Brevundimonas sp. TaxID=1871086 RepID=UPI002737EF6C|nr:TerC family protein [Brevundimonas sp.]MDP3802240.1 TerC family protein [Brevundimonas sp.]